MATLVVEGDRLLRDGRPHLIISGAIHYFRVHPELWEDRLKRLVALGCNTVETYVAWNYHAPTPDEVLFDGPRDLGRFLDLARDLGLDAIVRPGPYICAEWENGGFPAWLMRHPHMRLRVADAPYLVAVDEWFDVLIPLLANHQHTRGGNIIAVQVENEYGSYGDDSTYLTYLRDGLIRRGIDELLLTSDGPSRFWLQGGRVEGTWTTVNFGSRVNRVLGILNEELPDQPHMCMEFWNGWFDHWGDDHHTRPAMDVAADLDSMLTARMSVNFYMAHGGTNFGFWAGANDDGELNPTTTSYDYNAPISESGELTDKFYACREVIGRFRSLPPVDEHLAQLGITEHPPVMAPTQITWNQPTGLRDLPLWTANSVTAIRPPHFEEVGINHGMMLLRRTLEIDVLDDEPIAPLKLYGLADRAYVFINGYLVGVATGAEQCAVELEPHRDILLAGGQRVTVTLELLVENQGRANFGPHLGSPKGITKGVWFRVRYLNNWEVVPLPLDEMGVQIGNEAAACTTHSASLPLVMIGTFHAPGGHDCYVNSELGGRGIVWIDGFCLGRYWNIGPQQTLYVPSPMLTKGTHRITVLELESEAAQFTLTDQQLFYTHSLRTRD